ncbi:hypothetical protein BJ138DRAFT_1153845 [Hygrophoropsis aurantiaca]|uniref:Uncharacterized protein n=1 Tax=Hygrophoropsis aurantiaca TaxID=72124 RepID=A0ACB8AAE0_9AGAM|nr:hypothetical protein BJ138DRAFT_1153845 [Hygrophoropsis aurantiaca]
MTSMGMQVNGPVRVNALPLRAHTDGSGPLMRLMGTRRSPLEDDEDYQTGVEIFPPPGRKRSQKDQDDIDDKARKKAMRDLVNSWQERLQLISVITTFFASIEAGMLVNTTPSRDTDTSNYVLKASNAGLMGALVMHVYAAVLSFLAAFLLIRYKLKEATKEEMMMEGIQVVQSPLGGSLRVKTFERDGSESDGPKSPHADAPPKTARSESADSQDRDRAGSLAVEPPIITRNPHIEQVGPFRWNITLTQSSHLLSRFHTLCIFLSAAGFVLAIMGIILYSWALQPIEVSVFATVCLGGAILAMLTLVVS